MTAAKKLNLVSVEDYLAGELESPIKHEYLGGIVYAMAGARNAHNRIASRTLLALGRRLDDGPCEAFNSDTKIRIRLPNQIRFYYPDVSVICCSNPDQDSWQDEPIAVFEVLSPKTRRIDEGEKKEAYLTISSLRVYGLIETESARVVIHRWTKKGFVPEVYDGLDAVVPLPEINAELPLAEIYKGVELTTEPSDDSD